MGKQSQMDAKKKEEFQKKLKLARAYNEKYYEAGWKQQIEKEREEENRENLEELKKLKEKAGKDLENYKKWSKEERQAYDKELRELNVDIKRVNDKYNNKLAKKVDFDDYLKERDLSAYDLLYGDDEETIFEKYNTSEAYKNSFDRFAKIEQARIDEAKAKKDEKVAAQDQVVEDATKGKISADEYYQQVQEGTVENKVYDLMGKGNQIPAYDNSQATDKKEPQINYSDLYREYGNNFFELTTYDRWLNGGKGGYYTLAGVLKEVPSFSMSTTWEKGPASTVSDTVKGFMCSSVMEMVTTLGGHDQSWMNLDEGTDRVYASTGRPSFSLNFKLFTTDTIGSKKLSDWQTWIRALSLYATPSIDSKVNISRMADNAIDGALGSIDLVVNGINAAKEATSDKSIKETVTNLGNIVAEIADKVTGKIAERDGPNRVTSKANSENRYGAKLWKLRILPFIFNKPLIVYISNWGVTYSKEINVNTGEPIWIEFKITCEMDQVASAPVWNDYMN